MNKRGIEALVGLFVLMGLAALVFLALKAANLAKMKAISAKKQKPSVKPETPMEMTVLEHDDSTVPEFLQRSDLKALGV